MKKWIICSIYAATVLTAQATNLIAEDDFSGGTTGTNIAGRTDTLNFGTWTNAGILNLAEFGAGDYVTTPYGVRTGGGALAADYSYEGTGGYVIKMTVDFIPRGHAMEPKTEKLTFGFFEDINKGYLANTTADAGDVLCHDFQLQNPNNPKNEGGGNVWFCNGSERVNLGYPTKNGTVELGTNDTISLTMIYSSTLGEMTIETFFTDSGDSISERTYEVAPDMNFNYAAFAFSLSDGGATNSNPAQVTNFKVESFIVPSTNEWLTIENHQWAFQRPTNSFLSVSTADGPIVLANDNEDPKTHWRLLESPANSGKYLLENRWANQQGLTQANLWLDSSDNLSLKLNEADSTNSLWAVEENYVTGNTLTHHILSIASNNELWGSLPESDVSMTEGSGWKTSWRIRTAPEIDEPPTAAYLSTSFNGGSLIISASNLLLGAESTLYSTPMLNPSSWTPVGSVVTGVAETNWVISTTNNMEFFKVISE